MNKRQAKKRYKKIHGYNPPKEPDIEILMQAFGKLDEVISVASDAIIAGLKQTLNLIAAATERISHMSNEEFETLVKKFEEEHNCQECVYFYSEFDDPEVQKDCHWQPSEDEEERPCERGGKE